MGCLSAHTSSQSLLIRGRSQRFRPNVNSEVQLQYLFKFLEKRKEHFRWFTCWQTDRNLGELLLKPFCPCILLLKCRASQQKSPEDFFGVSIRTCPGSHCNYGRSDRAR